MVWEPMVTTAIIAGAGLTAALAARHRFSLLVGTQLLVLAAVRVLAVADLREMAVLCLVIALPVLLLALRLSQESEAAEQPPEPPP